MDRLFCESLVICMRQGDDNLRDTTVTIKLTLRRYSPRSAIYNSSPESLESHCIPRVKMA